MVYCAAFNNGLIIQFFKTGTIPKGTTYYVDYTWTFPVAFRGTYTYTCIAVAAFTGCYIARLTNVKATNVTIRLEDKGTAIMATQAHLLAIGY